MLNLKLADAYVDLTLDTKRFDQQLAYVRAKLLTFPKTWTINLTANTVAAHARINLLIQQLQTAQGLARLNVTAPGIRGGRPGGGGRLRVARVPLGRLDGRRPALRREPPDDGG